MSLTPWEIFDRIPNADEIAAALKDVPYHWSLTPLQDKAPKRLDWQTEPFIPHEVIASLITKGEQVTSKRTGEPYRRYWSGFGLRTGDASGGLLAIDVDGVSAQPILEAMSGGDLPTTVSWTSGKLGRYQLLFQIPPDIRINLQNFTRYVVTQWQGLETAKDESGKPSELLEFRYNRCQSALCPSRHPETGSYQWINSPADSGIALAPTWLCNLLLDFASEEQRHIAETSERVQRVKTQRQERKLTPISSNNGSLSDGLNLSLNRLNPEDVFNWAGHNWRVQGRYKWAGYCPQHDSKSGTAFKVNINTLEWHCFGCDVGGHAAQYRHFVNGGNGTPKGREFAEIVKGLANEAGVSLQETKSNPKTQKKYIKPIEELPDAGFHIIRQFQDELLEKFDALGTKRGQEWLKLREFTPDVTINSQYFDYDFKPGENLAIKSGLGTGKSHFINAKWLANPEEGAVLGGYRNALNEQFCVNGKELNGRPWYQIQQDLKGGQELALLADSESRIAGAVDSWIYFAPHHFDRKKVISDEVESVAKHLNQSSTAVSYYRDTIKSRVGDALRNSSANLIADGNLRDFTVNYFEELSGRKFTKILNEYKGNRGKIYLYNGSSGKKKATEQDVQNGLATQVGEWISVRYKADDYSKMFRTMMDLPIDIPLLVLSDSQKKCEVWDRMLSRLGRKVFRLDSTTSGTDLGKLFLQNPAKFILQEKIDTVILSPSGESGISIELEDELKRAIPGYFKYEFSYFFGTSTTDPQLQCSGRNRDPYTTRFVYIQSRSLLNPSQITDEASSSSVLSGWAEMMRDCASLSLQGIERGEILKIALQKLEAQLDDPHVRYESKLMLKESFERTYPRLCFEYAARDAGWEVITIESKKDDLSDQQEEQKEISEERALAIYKAEDIDTSQVETLSKKLKKEPRERYQIAKARLLSKLPGIEQKTVSQCKKITNLEQLKTIEETETEKILTINEMPYEEWKLSDKPIPEKGAEVVVEKSAFNPELIDKVLNRDRKLLSRIESLFLLKNPEICKLIQQNKWHKKLDLLTDPDETRAGSLPIARYRSKWLEIHTLYEIGISFFLNPESCWDNESPEAIAFWEKGKTPINARNIGVSPEKDPCTYIGKVLARFELKTKTKQKSRIDGTRYREYSIKPLNSEIESLYECVENRINIRVSALVFDWKKILKNQGVKTAETLTGNEEFATHLHTYNLIKIREEVCSETPVSIDGFSPNEDSELEQLIEALPFADSVEDFASIVEGCSRETVENAIAFSGDQPRRQQLQSWLEALNEPIDDSWVVFALKDIAESDKFETLNGT